MLQRLTRGVRAARSSRPMISTRSYASKHPLAPNNTRTSATSISRNISPLSAILLSIICGTTCYAIGLSSDSSSVKVEEKSEYKPPTQEGFDISFIEIQRLLPDDCWSDDREVLEAHGFSSWAHHNPAALPGLVIYPRNTEDVVSLVKLANLHHIPITPYSGGTSLEGHTTSPGTPSNPTEIAANSQITEGEKLPLDQVPRGLGWCMDFSENMGEILEINRDDLDIVVQPGLTYDFLNSTLRDKGIPLFFPVDPAPGAMVGGLVGTGASGTNAFRYGTMRENVLNLTVVLPSGEIIKTRSRSKKSSAGPNLTQLFIGSEGTLGIVVEATLKLQPVLPTSVAVAHFKSIGEAAATARDIVQEGISVACVELLDNVMMKAINAKNGSSRAPWEESSTLFIKFTGSIEGMKTDIARVQKLVIKNGGSKTFTFAKNEKEADEIWYSRKIALWSALEFGGPGARIWTTDSCVPISQLPAFLNYAATETKNANLIGPIVAHAADGNVHSLMLYRNEEEFKRVDKVVHDMVKFAQSVGGTCTGEHGIGIGKREFLVGELGIGTVSLLRSVKHMIDPKNIMNPGKLIPKETK